MERGIIMRFSNLYLNHYFSEQVMGFLSVENQIALGVDWECDLPYQFRITFNLPFLRFGFWYWRSEEDE